MKSAEEMPHKQSYSVTEEVSLPQPHVTYEEAKPRNRVCSGWTAFVTVGILAVTMILCMYFFGGSRLFLVPLDPRAGLIPLIKQGHLQIYPLLSGTNIGIKSLYSTELPPKNIRDFVKEIQNLFKNYPSDPEERYRLCWLENPTYDEPCFFDPLWLTEACSATHSYGYEESSNGTYNPCLIMKLVETGTWMPSLVPQVYLPSSVRQQYDPAFVPVDCTVNGKNENGTRLNLQTETFPPKGFSKLYFPVSTFNSSFYLAPLVAVQVKGIRKGQTVKLECSVLAQNSFYLWENGIASITFNAV